MISNNVYLRQVVFGNFKNKDTWSLLYLSAFLQYTNVFTRFNHDDLF